jgi:hypothetical protein
MIRLKIDTIFCFSLQIEFRNKMEVQTMEFREASFRFHLSMDKKERAEQGIFFTPKKARDILFQKLKEFKVEPNVILEPSFGTGEFIEDAVFHYPKAKILGVEKNPDLFQSLDRPGLVCGDFLEWSGKADLIIGNPPYFVMKSKSKHPAMTGRPNIYILFLYKCLTEHLTMGGTLAFILPTSLYNSSYYQPMRDYIYTHTTVLHLETLKKPGFHDTSQETMLLILKLDKGNNKKYFLDYKGLFLTPYAKELRNLVKGTKTIQELGMGVKTGNIVWNQHKEKLSDTGTLLIYSSNIEEGELVFPLLKHPKKQYIQIDKPTLTGPNLLVERGYGNGYIFQYVKVNQECYAENHVNVIYPKTEDNLDLVIQSFQNEKTSLFLKYFIGNGSLSATELETLFPIFV